MPLKNFQFKDHQLLWSALVAPIPLWLLLAPFSEPPLTPLWLLLLVAPVVEELAFRGAIQGYLLQQRWGGHRCGYLSYANLVTALLFALLHLYAQPSLWALLTFVPGLIFGAVRERYRTVIPAIALHSYYNGGLLLL
ncbi:JDVT-CTERM system CAAX-type protease [Ectothiorhodospiraceae bacterium BW-2]|nr:JDVT-CTERM system CAAX-type protease [Ectothiorhodospiraceae bacterium BW-2]